MPNSLTEALQGPKAQFAEHTTILPLLERWESLLTRVYSGASPKDLRALNDAADCCIRTIEGCFPLGSYNLGPLKHLRTIQPSE
jgi:hypothetical protein